MAYYSDPVNLFPGYTSDEGNYAVFPRNSLPTCSGNSANLNDIKEVLFSMLTVVDNDYAALPAYASGVLVQTKAKNFTISSNTNTGEFSVKKTFTVSFTANSQILDVVNESEFNPD
jgi:hypothetical protein